MLRAALPPIQLSQLGEAKLDIPSLVRQKALVNPVVDAFDLFDRGVLERLDLDHPGGWRLATDDG
jgi:hypothetical protein